MDYKFQGKAKGGSIKFNDRESVIKFLESVDDRPITVTIKANKQIRSLGWNNYYWAVVVPSVRSGLIDVGYEPDDLDNEVVHEYLKNKFLNKEKREKELFSKYLNVTIKVPEPSSKIETADFKEYVAAIQRWATQFLHIYIPDPNEGVGLGIG